MHVQHPLEWLDANCSDARHAPTQIDLRQCPGQLTHGFTLWLGRNSPALMMPAAKCFSRYKFKPRGNRPPACILC
jgi:hypothetical protein